MGLQSLLKTKWLLGIPLLLALLIAAACGEDATPTAPPTATTAPAVPTATTAAAQPTATTAATKAATKAAQPTAMPQAKKFGMEDLAFVQKGKYGGFPIPMWASAYSSNWDLHKAPTLHSTRAVRALYNGLVHYDFKDNRNIICDLCESWSLAEDGVTYTFNINPKAIWSNGEPVTATDVKFSLDRMVDPDEVFPRAKGIGTYYDSSKAIDAKTLELVTKFPAAAFLKFLALDYMVIYNKKHVESTDPETLDQPEGAMGSGGFLEAGVLVGESYTVEKKPQLLEAWPALPGPGENDRGQGTKRPGGVDAGRANVGLAAKGKRGVGAPDPASGGKGLRGQAKAHHRPDRSHSCLRQPCHPTLR
jgi:ABC-type transport system substrate-binding protein